VTNPNLTLRLLSRQRLATLGNPCKQCPQLSQVDKLQSKEREALLLLLLPSKLAKEEDSQTRADIATADLDNKIWFEDILDILAGR
jgi:hypothetical protein